LTDDLKENGQEKNKVYPSEMQSQNACRETGHSSSLEDSLSGC